MIYISKDSVSEVYIQRNGNCGGNCCDDLKVKCEQNLQTKNISVTENGSYIISPDDGYSLSQASVDVNVPDKYMDGYNDGLKYGEDKGKDEGFKEGYNSGKEDGLKEGEEKGKEEGLKEGEAKGRTEGIEQGKAEQKSLLTELSVDRNGTYQSENGYSKVSVNVECDGCDVIEKTITKNGDYNAYEDDVDGYSKVTVDVRPNLQSKSVSVKNNGSLTINPDSNYDGLSAVNLNVDVEGIEFSTKEITIKNNGVYEASNEDVDGYSKVTVDVEIGHSEEELNQKYQEGYDKGKSDGVKEGEASGIEKGKEEQKGLMKRLTVELNGTYSNENGYSSVKAENTLLKLVLDGYGQTPYHIKKNEWPEGIVFIGNYAFATTEVDSVEWPDNLTRIGEYSFYSCHRLNYTQTAVPKPKFTIPSTVNSIGKYAFSDCFELTDYVISDAVTEIKENTFSYCGFNKNTTGTLIIPDGVETIGDYAFYNNRWIKELHIGKGVKSIGSNGINFDANVSASAPVDIYCHAVVAPTVEDDSLNTKHLMNYTHTVHYPVGSDYSSWKEKFTTWVFVEDIND